LEYEHMSPGPQHVVKERCHRTNAHIEATHDVGKLCEYHCYNKRAQ
jgi:hypothetical protein